MATFAFLILACNGIALWLSTVIIINLGWQWVGWISLIVSMIFCVLYLVALPETRANVLLYRKKLRLQKETGKKYYAVGEEERMADWRKMVTGSLTRPICELTAKPDTDGPGLTHLQIFWSANPSCCLSRCGSPSCGASCSVSSLQQFL